jgi:hypothetical protein
MSRESVSLVLSMCLCLLPACSGPQDDLPAIDDGNTGTPPVVFAERSLEALAASAASSITTDYLREVVTEIASDRYEGRGPGSAGDRLTQQYLAEALAAMGYQPGGDNGTWLQPFELMGINAAQPPTWTFNAGDNVLQLTQHEDFIAASGVQASEARVVNAEVVFVGYGIQAPEYDWDDYKGVDLTGKVLLMLNNDPDWDPDLFAGDTRLWYGRWDYKYLSAARQGAAGAIIIHTQPSAGYPFQVVQTSWTGEQYELPAGDEPRSPISTWVTEEAAYRLVSLAGLDLDSLRTAAREREFVPVPLGITTSLTLPVALNRTGTANVIGLLPGSDPALRDEVVIYTAHHDHLGMAEPGDDPQADRIYNGAMDNASGVALILAVAKAFAEMDVPPRRSIMINFVGAEEQGLLGSLYHARHPTFPPGKIAANINVDGTSIWGRTRDVTFVGYGKSSLDAVVEEMVAFQGRTLTGDQFPDRGTFYRSDQFSFARAGVPAIYLKNGTDIIGLPPGSGVARINEYTDVHYHQPSDEIDETWNFEGAVEDAILNFMAGWRIANSEALPMWNPGDEFEVARLQSLQSLE